MLESWQNRWRASIAESQNKTEALGNIFAKKIKDALEDVSLVVIKSSICRLNHEHHTVDGLDLLFELFLQHFY